MDNSILGDQSKYIEQFIEAESREYVEWKDKAWKEECIKQIIGIVKDRDWLKITIHSVTNLGLPNAQIVVYNKKITAPLEQLVSISMTLCSCGAIDHLVLDDDVENRKI